MKKPRTTLTDVSPSSGQLKRNFSTLERIQLDAINSTPGTVSQGAGKINGNVSNILRNGNNTNRSQLELGLHYAAAFENTGLTRDTTRSILSSILSPAIANKQPFYKKNRDAFTSSQRTPDSNRKTPYEEMKEKKESIVGEGDLNYGGLIFPADLQSKTSTYVALEFHSYSRGSPQGAGSLTPGGRIMLPLPETFEQSHTINYGEQELGTLGRALETNTGKAAIGNIEQQYKQGTMSLGSFTSALDNSSLGGDATDIAKAAGLNMISSTDIGGVLSRNIAGKIANPHPTVFFQGLNLRKFTWTWKLVPRDPTDASHIKTIIKEIKKRCLPKKAGSFLTYPDAVKPIVIGNDLADDYKKCFVASINVNFSGEGTSAFFFDGHPVSIILSLEFQEMEAAVGGS